MCNFTVERLFLHSKHSQKRFKIFKFSFNFTKIVPFMTLQQSLKGFDSTPNKVNHSFTINKQWVYILYSIPHAKHISACLAQKAH